MFIVKIFYLKLPSEISIKQHTVTHITTNLPNGLGLMLKVTILGRIKWSLTERKKILIFQTKLVVSFLSWQIKRGKTVELNSGRNEGEFSDLCRSNKGKNEL